MKKDIKTTSLLKSISQKQLLFGGAIVLGSLVILYVLTRAYIVAEAKESLYHTSFRIEQRLIGNQEVSPLFPFFEIHLVDVIYPDTLKDTLIFDALQQEKELFKVLNTYKNINGKNYHIVTRTIVAEYEDTLVTILITFGVIIILVYLAQFSFNRYLNKTIWTPFFKNLEVVKAFSMSSEQPIQLEASDISEFSELNIEIEALTLKVTTDYQNLKQFNENLSHELQTPLAIIQAKIENMIDGSEDLSQNHLKTLYEIQTNTKRLSKLNKGLILLTRIDNQHFNSVETISVNTIVKEILENLQDILNHKQIGINFSADSEAMISMDKTLADILFTNLIGNAIKHTDPKGNIAIVISDKSFKISNTGNRQITDFEHLFHRFYKENRQSKSLGLGLAIVKKVCDYYNFEVFYKFSNETHQFEILF